jgi:DNA repair exonuclease SbcCD ATPase subunit
VKSSPPELLAELQAVQNRLDTLNKTAQQAAADNEEARRRNAALASAGLLRQRNAHQERIDEIKSERAALEELWNAQRMQYGEQAAETDETAAKILRLNTEEEQLEKTMEKEAKDAQTIADEEERRTKIAEEIAVARQRYLDTEKRISVHTALRNSAPGMEFPGTGDESCSACS